jgi:2-aminoethylphosphonate-pyruvate transaminase
MRIDELPDNPDLLLTPGPLSTTKTVKAVMLRDWCTWDDDYHEVVQGIRAKLASLASWREGHTALLMQGSGTFAVESCIGTAVPADGKLLVLANGAYGDRIGRIAEYLRIPVAVNNSGEVRPPDLAALAKTLGEDAQITHVAVVHCETTTGMLHPVREIGRVVKSFGRVYIVDAMSSFGGIPMDMSDLGADFLVSSANKCIQGVPGFGFVIARQGELEKTKGRARSLSLDMYDQWEVMERGRGKWRFTSPTHVVRAFAQALMELDEEGGVEARYRRYRENHRIIVTGMRNLGFVWLLPDEYQSPIITSFLSPNDAAYSFSRFYGELKRQGFVIYPGKVTSADTFRIGNIGHIRPADITRLLEAVQRAVFWPRS